MFRLFVFISLSLFVHQLIGVLLYLTQPLQKIKTPNVTEIEITETPKKSISEVSKQKIQNKIYIPQQVKTDKPQDLFPTKTQFFAEQAQRVKQETRAEKLGDFKNVSSHASKEQTQNEESKNKADALVPDSLKSVKQKSRTLSSDQSSIPFELSSDIAIGQVTLLNADADLNASFYNRVTELFYVRWGENLNLLWNKMTDEQKQKLAGQRWITELEVKLDLRGVYSDGYILKSSGFKPFDEAGLFAFKQARFFPNPPQNLVLNQSDLRLKYRIAVVVR